MHSIIEIFFSSLDTELILSSSVFLSNNVQSAIIKSKNTLMNISNTDFLDNVFTGNVFLLDKVIFNMTAVVIKVNKKLIKQELSILNIKNPYKIMIKL